MSGEGTTGLNQELESTELFTTRAHTTSDDTRWQGFREQRTSTWRRWRERITPDAATGFQHLSNGGEGVMV